MTPAERAIYARFLENARTHTPSLSELNDDELHNVLVESGDHKSMEVADGRPRNFCSSQTIVFQQRTQNAFD